MWVVILSQFRQVDVLLRSENDTIRASQNRIRVIERSQNREYFCYYVVAIFKQEAVKFEVNNRPLRQNSARAAHHLKVAAFHVDLYHIYFDVYRNVVVQPNHLDFIIALIGILPWNEAIARVGPQPHHFAFVSESVRVNEDVMTAV